MNTIPTVTVALSALNEQDNILDFLNSVLMQDESGFVLEKILVISDGSTDKTVDLVQSLRNPKIELVEGRERIGKSSRLNELYANLTSDILVQSDADVVFSHPNVIRDLIKPLVADPKIGMCGGHPLPIQGTTFTERAVNCTVMAYDTFRATFRGGDNVFSSDGRILAYRKELVKLIKIPSDMIANDMFTYFCTLSLGFKYAYVASAVVWFRSPQTMKDQIRQNTRFVAAPARMKKYFPEELVNTERNIPFHLFLMASGRQFIKHPILCTYIFMINIYCRIRAIVIRGRLSALWDVAFSTKNLNPHDHQN